MSNPFDVHHLDLALRRLGEIAAVKGVLEVDVLLVGGAAAMVTGLLPAERVTMDCDVMLARPADAMAILESAAERVSEELGLPPRWFNGDVQLRRDLLPDRWHERKVWVGMWGGLRVFAASRLDLIAMKLVAGRDQDIQDLHAMGIGRHDESFLRRHLASLAMTHHTASVVDDAIILLEAILGDGS